MMAARCNTKFSVVICTYGDHLNVIKTCLSSLVAMAKYRGQFDITVCCNSVSKGAADYLYGEYLSGRVNRIIFSDKNVNKDQMMLAAMELIDTKFMFWLDDDTVTVEKGWDEDVIDIISKEPNVAVVSKPWIYPKRTPQYIAFLKERPWYRHGSISEFDLRCSPVKCPVGWCMILNVDTLKQIGFPDRGMHHKNDDVLIVDALAQYGIPIRWFSEFNKLNNKIKSQPIHYKGTRGSNEF